MSPLPLSHPHPRRQQAARAWRLSLGTSLTVHAVVLTTLASLTVWLTLPWRADPGSPESPPVLVVSSDYRPRTEPLLAVEHVMELPQSVAASGTDHVSPRAVRRMLDDAIRASRELPHDHRFEQLEELTARLPGVATQQSIAELTDIFSQVIPGTRHANPTGLVSDVFDTETGQLDDVLFDAESGSYTAVLVDAHGRRRQVAVDAATGNRAYRVMQLLKCNPLVERIYREIVMGLLDELLTGFSPTRPSS